VFLAHAFHDSSARLYVLWTSRSRIIQKIRDFQELRSNPQKIEKILDYPIEQSFECRQAHYCCGVFLPAAGMSDRLFAGWSLFLRALQSILDL